MKKYSYIFLLLFTFLCSHAYSQEPIPFDDFICMGENDSFDLSVNDSFPFGQIIIQDGSGCFRTNGYFLIFNSTNPDCECDKLYDFIYFYEANVNVRANVRVEIKCEKEKPECFLTDLSILDNSGPAGMDECLYSCENETSTYFVPHAPGNSYSWVISGAATYSTNTDGNEIYITWGSAGSGNIYLTVNNGGAATTYDFCVDILEGPIADFSVLSDCVCKNGSITFMNNSMGANNYLWDFGDGNTSTLPDPTHMYTAGGTYTVTLYAYRNNQDPEGNPLCCCTDSMQMNITVEDLEGPDIYWVSTLCPGDKSIYWTDADCSSYSWIVLDENGSPVSFTTMPTNDTICVTWGSGPFGTVSLQVSGCTQAYCSKPSNVVVPIVSATAPINGDDEVCVGATETYDLQKWPSVYYDWSVTGGTIIGGDGSNVVTIQWGSGPVGTIHVDYSSDFLGGLPGHDQSDCAGTADLTVSILPKFSVTGPSPAVACVNDMSSFSATPLPSSNYNWTITPFAPFTGNGTANINVTWNTGPGVYVIQAVTNSPADYCNDTVTTVMSIIEMELPDSIVGPSEICPNSTYTYLGYTSTPNTTLEWTVTGGTPSSYTGSPITITWNATGPYALEMAQKMVAPPGCISDPISFALTEKAIVGPLFFPSLPACVNEQVVYVAGPAQDDEAVLEWKISPIDAGSVISGQGTLSPTIQWNNVPGPVNLEFCVTLCGQTQTYSDLFALNAPLEPTITQIGDLCPGVIATLDATSGFSMYNWSGPVVSTMEDITISSGGTYVLQTTDVNGCSATVTYEPIELPSPVANISTPDPLFLCSPDNGQSVTLHAQTNPSYKFTWYCDNVIVQGPSTVPTFTHLETSDKTSFDYCVLVVDTVTGCEKKSNNLIVVQDTCPPGTGGGGCVPQNYTLNVGVTNGMPDCNVATFNTNTSANVIITGWNFGDPNGNINDGTLTMAEHEYTKASYYTARVNAQVPDATSTSTPPDYCNVFRDVSVCIPLAADFTFNDSCLQVCFENLSTFLPGQGGLSYLWEFDDGFISVDENPCHTYLSSGSYDVTLTVTNLNGCVASFVDEVELASFGSVSMNITPPVACVGDPISFNGSGSGIVSWLWDFDDGSENGAQNAGHAYLAAGNYDVSLTVSNLDGCDTTLVSNVVIYPNPLDDTISYSPSLIICEGEQVMLNAPSGPYTYLWSNGATSSFLLTGVAGDYSVQYTDANGCMNETDAVTVTVIPLPTVDIGGPSYICDDGCVTLQATLGSGYQYQWLDNLGMPLLGQTLSTLDICDFMPLPMTVYVEVTDANGCVNQAGPHTVDIAASPVFNISIVGDTCEGMPNILSVPVLPDVRYQWSTGASGTSISVIAAGTYSVVGTDTVTNCSTTESVVIHPLPDLCIVPTGCYEVCNPDTICGPGNLFSYQWNMNGIPIPGETNQCLIVSASGSYSLTGVNEFGCELTSDTLILMVIECPDCEEQDVISKELDGNCCYSLSFVNNYASAYYLNMHTGDADIDPDLGSLHPSLGVNSIGSNFIELRNATAGSPLPAGTLFDYLQFCLNNITNVPQTVIFDWYNDTGNIVCSDTLLFDCPIDSDCIYIADDTLFCEGEELIYEVTICNSSTNTFDIEYLVFDPMSPVGVGIVPPFLDLGGTPITPGTCQTHVFMLTGSGLANQLFCYNLIGHSADPAVDPEALCCSLDTLHCVPIPGCTPCDMVYVEDVSMAEDSCCYDITLYNGYDPLIFDGIDICNLSSNAGLSINNPQGSNWILAGISQNRIALDYNSTVPAIPLGSISLPTLCIDSDGGAFQLIEIKWMNGDDIICRDTIELFCEPDCGYIKDDDAFCEGTNFWYFEGSIVNTSGVTMHEAVITFNDPTLSAYNQTIALGSLPSGSTFGPIFISLGAPASAGDVICFTVTLHEIGHDDQHINCCSFEHCFTLPNCGQQDPCVCDQNFENQVDLGFSCNIVPGLVGQFSPLGMLQLCDRVYWEFDDGSPILISNGIQSVIHTFPEPGEYEVCMTVVRLDVNGKKCKARFCKEVTVKQTGEPNVFPNPVRQSVNIEWPDVDMKQVEVKLYNLNHEMLLNWKEEMNETKKVSDFDLRGVAPGVYVLMMESEDEQWVKRIIVL